MAMANNAQFGVTWGEVQVGTSPIQLVPGLTTSMYVTVKPLSTNRGDLYIFSATGAGSGTGMRLEPTEPPTDFYLNYDNSSLKVQATTNGNTVTFITKEGPGR